MSDSSFATIQSTSILGHGSGGIWQINLLNNSSLYMSGGQVNMISINNSATVILTGGLITGIFSYQSAWKYAGDPPTLVPNPHITIVYSGTLPTRNPTTQMLTGLWGDGSGFSIYLPNISGYSPAMENIKFTLIPEPLTLALLALGGLLIRRK